VRSPGDALRRLLSRFAGRRTPAPSRSSTLEAILHTAAAQRAAQRRIATAGVRRADLERAIREQRRLLEQAGAQIAEAIAVADRAGADARAAHENAQPYEAAVAGLLTQRAVLDTAAAQLERQAAPALETAAEAQRLLDETGRALDAALRAQVSLLARLERLQRQRAIAEATLRAREADQPGGV
jgi:hypothetical protein